ncbi:hypothetical protein [Nocardia sp. CA-290969]|uniref:hypothetical protein n=1 Tax=Nocardia sp. CA-290969 TaxID=3239986 RepID=UPI003D9424D0
MTVRLLGPEPAGEDEAVRLRDLTDGWQIYQTFTVHAVGAGQLDLGLWIPYDCTLLALRYRCAIVGSGGTVAVELRRNGIDPADAIPGTSFAPAITPAWNAISIDLDEDDLVWPWMTAANTDPGAQVRMEAKVVRR